MVDVDVVGAKLKALDAHLARVRLHAKPSEEELARNQDALELVAFNLMLAIQVCLDVASHIIADEGWPPPSTFAEAFQRLREHGVLSDDVAAALGRAAGFRNVVAHAYGAIDIALLHQASIEGPADLDRFARQVAAWVQERTARS